MDTNRRRLLALTATAAASVTGTQTANAAPVASPISALGVDAAQFGLRPGSSEDQTRALQRALDETARTRSPLALPPGSYRVGDVKLPPGAQLVGARGATRLMLSIGASVI